MPPQDRNVLFVSHTNNSGGAVSSLLEIINNLPTEIKPYVLVSSTGPLTKKLEKNNIGYITIPFSWWITEPKTHSLAFPYQAVRNIYAYLEYIFAYSYLDIDLVYTNTVSTPIGSLISYKIDCPHICHIHEYVDDDHGYNFTYTKKRSMDLLNSTTDYIIYNSKSVKEKHTNYVSNPDEAVVYNGPVSQDQIDKNGYKNGGINKEIHLLVVGTIKDGKNQIEAVSTIHQSIQSDLDVKLEIVGKGNEKYINKCKKRSEELGISDHIEWEGYVENVYEYYNKADILLVPSKSEAFGRIIIEAMSCGTPVIGRRSGALPELIQHGKTGFLYTDIGEIVDYLKKLYGDKQLVEEISKNSVEYVSTKFTTEEYSGKINSIILDALV